MMNRIILHHTGGTYSPNSTDRRAYHRLIDGEGRAHDGVFAIEANAPGKIQKGAYAPHTLSLNTGSIGVSICAMGGGQWSDPFSGKYPVKHAQVDELVREVADLSKSYGIPIRRRTVLSHAEVEITLGVRQRNKWDFDYNPRGGASRDPVGIGDEIREEILNAMNGTVVQEPVEPREMLCRGSTGYHVRAAQAALGVTVDGDFGPNTYAAVVKFQIRNGLLPDGIVGRMTWAALL